MIIDGLGDHQLAHSAAATLRRHRRAALIAPFPTTTSVGLSYVTTAQAPMQHGVIGYTQWMPTLGTVMNMLEWVDMTTGQPADLDPTAFHPSPNLPERLDAAGVRTMIYQPTELLATPVSNMLCRGAERYGYASPLDIQPSVTFGADHRTLAVVYTTAVDTAAHASGQRSQAYRTALSQTGRVWEHFRIRRSLPPDSTLIGSADHGHCDIPPDPSLAGVLRFAWSEGVRWWRVSTTSAVWGAGDWGLDDGGFVPGAGVGSDGGEGSSLSGAAPGGECDAAAAGGELVAADAVEVAQGSGGGEVLVSEVGIADVRLGEGLVDEGLDEGSVDADSDVSADSLFGPVPYGPEA